MELSTRYTPADTEARWYEHWEKRGYFTAKPDGREPFSIVIPPPNVTGILHMGHMLNNTIQDILIRKARLDGKNACWIPGTDHASIATEAKVVRWLREEKGLKKGDLGREEFMGYAYQWKEKYGGIILSQLKKIGASCDWSRTAFTMDKGYSEDVIRVFVDLYKKEKLYRGYRMVNWDPEAKTVLSNEEVLHNEENARLYHVKYLVEGTDNQWVVIATQRPETIMADTGLAVHPDDPRYAFLKGKKVIVPLVNRAVPVIFDEYVDKEFGTGALKVTPAHDPNDYELGQKHGLEVIDTIADDGKLNELAIFHVGKDRFEARELVAKDLEAAGLLVKTEEYRTNIGRSERTNAVVEPKLSLQWYVKMGDLAKPALDSVMSDEIEFFPKNFKNTYRHWMENVRDWCISRQLWWGHRIPAWYLIEQKEGGQNGPFVSETADGALAEARAQTGNNSLTINDLKQDEDVLDTWFSSWLWPISTLGGFQDSEDFNYYYPTSVLVTGWDIIFLWVARMAMAGYEWKGKRPFERVYFTGMVRDKQRRKMSKSLGNSPDALKLIEDFGADGVRYGLMSSAAAGGDILFDEKLCENGRNFSNKMWNALRLVKGWPVDERIESAEIRAKNALAVKWMEERIDEVLGEIKSDFEQFRLSEAVMSLYKLIWDDFCSWFLEMIKPGFEQPIDGKTMRATIRIYEKLMVALHPFMPFVTEEIWHQLAERAEGDDCCIQKYPTAGRVDRTIISRVETAKEVITKIRELRNVRNLKPREELVVFVQKSENAEAIFGQEGLKDLIVKLANLSSLEFSESADVPNSVSFIGGTEKYFVVLNQTIDTNAEREKLQKELDHIQKFLKSVSAKLSNERFVASAPAAVVEGEKKKMADSQERIRAIEESLAGLG